MSDPKLEYQSPKRLLFLLKCGWLPLILCIYYLYLIECTHRMLISAYSPLTPEQYEFLSNWLYNSEYSILLIAPAFLLWGLLPYCGIMLAVWLYRATKNSCLLSNREPGLIPVGSLFLLFVPLLNLIAFLPVFSLLIKTSSRPDQPIKSFLIPIPLLLRTGIFLAFFPLLGVLNSAINWYFSTISEETVLFWNSMEIDCRTLFLPVLIGGYVESLLRLINNLQEGKSAWLKEQFMSCTQCGEPLDREVSTCPVCGDDQIKEAQSSSA